MAASESDFLFFTSRQCGKNALGTQHILQPFLVKMNGCISLRSAKGVPDPGLNTQVVVARFLFQGCIPALFV